MAGKLIQFPKFRRLSTEPNYLPSLRKAAYDHWEARGKPEGSPQVDWEWAVAQNTIYYQQAAIQTDDQVRLVCGFEYRFVISNKPCYGCGNSGASVPEVGIYSVVEQVDNEYIPATTILWYQAWKVVTVRYLVGFNRFFRKN